ncbi:hypothetical protein CIHG_06511 [Coccidioides immitis H538.4]|uniref:Uncharacterized protein n=1 Tax=Coccidioides immitis H538.4 TaxID=396776 RepID=A0A0J8RXF7_COCIT|nr:hypothetical protein CIHG_06511 [Coccidioides immitis H538.4]
MAGQSNLPPLAPAPKNQGLVITRDSEVNLNGHFFNNLTAAMEYIDNQAPHYCYGLQVELMNALMRVTNVLTKKLTAFANLLQEMPYTNKALLLETMVFYSHWLFHSHLAHNIQFKILLEALLPQAAPEIY